MTCFIRHDYILYDLHEHKGTMLSNIDIKIAKIFIETINQLIIRF